MLKTTDPQILAEYTDLLMLQQRLRGQSYQGIAVLFGFSAVEVEARVDAAGAECVRGAMRATRADPAHPQPGLFKLEDFSLDPRRCMEVIMLRRLQAIEDRYGEKPTKEGQMDEFMRRRREKAAALIDGEKDREDKRPN